ncbi:MAG: adenine phosphoribosyltransferase [Gammaproteobacteria bacterium]|nr:adenine phosphoribosyltransferase [Gammaproteobacteria bacterium]
MMQEVIPGLSKKIRKVADFPKPGINFWDMTTLMKDSQAFKQVMDTFHDRYRDMAIDYVASIESRGLIFGSALAYLLGIGFIPIRKQGKLPADTYEQQYEKEYGSDTLAIHQDALQPGDRILLIDDLIATGHTAQAAADLIVREGAQVVEFAFITEFTDFNAREKLSGHKIYSLIICQEN